MRLQSVNNGLLFFLPPCCLPAPLPSRPSTPVERSLPRPPGHRPSPYLICLLPFCSCVIQMVSTSNASQAVTLVYAVGNQSSFLNGTVASSLLSQLSAELVGFYLTYPPLTIAEREYVRLGLMEQGPVVSPGIFLRSRRTSVVLRYMDVCYLEQLKKATHGGSVDKKFIAHCKRALA